MSKRIVERGEFGSGKGKLRGEGGRGSPVGVDLIYKLTPVFHGAALEVLGEECDA